MTKFDAFSNNGKFAMKSDTEAEKFRKFLAENPNVRLEIKPFLNDSRKQRGFYHGGVLALWAYLDGRDYTDGSITNQYHEIAKLEFNPEIFITGGKKYKIGGSTKGKLRDGFIDQVIDYLEESYGIDRTKVLDTELYKKFDNEIYMHGQYETFIDYMRDLKLLR